MTDLIRAQGLGSSQAIQLTSWPINAPIQTLALHDEIHVWRSHRVGMESQVDRYFPHLSLSEQQKSKTFRFDSDREDFVVGRGVLRKILSRYLGRPARDIEIRQNRFGKPFIVEPSRDLFFSQSQSGNEQVFAFSAKATVGVDLEYVDPNVDFWPLAQKHFSNSEMDQLLALPEQLRVLGFFKCWTQKEAYLKALGLGYEFDSRHCEMLVDPEMNPQLIRSKRQGDSENFRMYQLDLAKGYSCSLAIGEKHPWRFQTFTVR